MTYFHYEPVGEKLFDWLAAELRKGQSVTLLGPRYSGKRYVMNHVLRRLKDTNDSGDTVILPINAAVTTQRELGILIAKSVDGTSAADNIFDAVDRYWHKQKRPFILIVPNLDMLRHGLVQNFLLGLRARVEGRHLVTLIGADQNFREFVYGPASEFNCTNQVILQGFDELEFVHLVERYQEVVRFSITSDATQVLWEETGGQPFLLRALLYRAKEKRVRGDGIETAAPLTSEEAKQLPYSLPAWSSTSRRLFGQALDAIWRNPNNRFTVKCLLDDCVVHAPLEPSEMELAGAVIRKGKILQFSSSMAPRFFREYLTDRRYADLYAVAGDWKEAFSRYNKLDAWLWLRPDSALDRPVLDRILQKITLRITSSDTEQEAYAYFRSAVRCLLGFAEISWWRWNRGWEQDSAKNVLPADWPLLEPQCFPDDSAYAFSLSLPRMPENHSAMIEELPEPWRRMAVAASVELPGEDKPEILVISDVSLNRSISQDRLRMMRTLFTAFLPIITRARRTAWLQAKVNLRDRYTAVLDSILEGLDDLDLDQEMVCRRVAKALKDLGYRRRVLISMIDAKHENIVGVCEVSDPPDVDVVARMTNFPLFDAQSMDQETSKDRKLQDIQQWVMSSCKAFRTTDAAKEPLVNQEVVKATELQAFAIVPIIDRDGSPIGTIHVERSQTEMPSEEELDELIHFGRRLALLLAQGERITFISRALDQISEPLAIADASKRWRYANEPAAKLLGVSKSWRQWSKANTLGGAVQERLRDGLDRSLESPKDKELLLARQLEDLRSVGERHHLKTAPIRDVSKRVLGAIVTLHEFTIIHRLVGLLGKVIHAGSMQPALQEVLNSVQMLGHDKARIYLLDSTSAKDLLISKMAIGYKPEYLDRFKDGKIVLSPRTIGHYSWKSIDQRHGMIYVWNMDRKDGEIQHTSSGLEAEVVADPSHATELGKRPGDFWIDLPLFASDGRPLGKLATSISEQLDPQQSWALGILAALAAAVLETFQTHEQQEAEQKKWEKRGYEASVSTVAHHLVNRVIALDGILDCYREKEASCPELTEENEHFEEVLRVMLSTMERARDFLRAPEPQIARLDIADLAKRIFASHLVVKEVRKTFKCSKEHVFAYADQKLIAHSLAEVLDNARKAVKNRMNPEIQMTVDQSDHWIQIHVHDNGCGIRDDIRDRIFEEFKSGWSNGVEPSTGLGLGWTEKVLKAHGGSMTVVTSMFTPGASFCLKLPVSQEGNRV